MDHLYFVSKEPSGIRPGEPAVVLGYVSASQFGPSGLEILFNDGETHLVSFGDIREGELILESQVRKIKFTAEAT